MRNAFVVLFFACAAFGQKKPVTLEALQAWRSTAGARNVPGDPVWAPDGKTFVYRQGTRLKIYDIAPKKSRDVVDLAALDSLAATPPSPEHAEWENRRVEEAALQWAPQGGQVLYYSGGDLFLIAIQDGTWRQLLKTPVAERDPKFSSDGTRIAFRRDWDLYVLDIANAHETRLTDNGSDTLRNGGL